MHSYAHLVKTIGEQLKPSDVKAAAKGSKVAAETSVLPAPSVDKGLAQELKARLSSKSTEVGTDQSSGNIKPSVMAREKDKERSETLQSMQEIADMPPFASSRDSKREAAQSTASVSSIAPTASGFSISSSTESTCSFTSMYSLYIYI